ncbi:MAG: NUDIX domain-containing protein [Sedimentisphaerales bacterium]|nr:NUDIX domain-containing protein [Sedimentisphaerales bacterium]
MARQSAGLLMYRRRRDRVEVFLVHSGGPFWARKDRGAWSIPKGEFTAEEDALAAARREFEEETGLAVAGTFAPLEPVKQAGGKIVHAWAVAGDCDPAAIQSNTFSMEWPPRSGRQQDFPEVDRADWFPIERARDKILKSQRPLLDQLAQRVDAGRLNPGGTA